MHPPLIKGWERFEVSEKDESENPNAVYRRTLDTNLGLLKSQKFRHLDEHEII